MTKPANRPVPRAVLRQTPSYKAGRAPQPRAGRPTYKLSSNETPFEPLPELLDAARGATERMNRYPDPMCTRLVQRLSERFDVPASQVTVATGSVALVYHVLQAICEHGDEVVYPWRSFEAYPIATKVVGATPVEIPLAPGARHDLSAMADAITERTRAVLVCTPNNPTGPVVHHGELEKFCDRVPENVLVIVDEAYVQFIRDDDAADGLALFRERPNICVLRTFSKAYGMADLRTGFAFAQDDLADAIRLCTLPFPVSTVAQETAIAALGCEDALFARVDELVRERTRVLTGLREQGWDVPDSQSNFVWLSLGDDTEAFALACEQEGAVVRPFAGDGCRITIGEPAANNLVLEVAGRWQAERRA